MNLKFKSTEADLKFNIQSQLTIINKNILYITREVDQIKKLLNSFKTEQQSLDYYGKKYGEELGTVFEETSPQTDNGDK